MNKVELILISIQLIILPLFLFFIYKEFLNYQLLRHFNVNFKNSLAQFKGNINDFESLWNVSTHNFKRNWLLTLQSKFKLENLDQVASFDNDAKTKTEITSVKNMILKKIASTILDNFKQATTLVVVGMTASVLLTCVLLYKCTFQTEISNFPLNLTLLALNISYFSITRQIFQTKAMVKIKNLINETNESLTIWEEKALQIVKAELSQKSLPIALPNRDSTTQKVL